MDVICFRTDFSDDNKWKNIKEKIKNDGEYECFLKYIEEKKFENTEKEKIIEFLNSINYEYDFFIICDSQSMNDETLLIININSKNNFRCRASLLWSPVNNLSIANMDFDEFKNNANDNNIFNGF